MTRKYDNEGPTLRVRLRYAEEEIARLRSEREELLGALRTMAAQHRCGCGHPACNRCEDDRMCEAAIAKCEGRSTGEDAT